MPAVRLAVGLWDVLKFFAASGIAFCAGAGFSFVLAKRMRDDDYPAWEAFVYSLCCYALVGVVWWHWLMRWWLHMTPRADTLFLVMGACASFFFSIFLGEFIAMDRPAQTTQRVPVLRALLALLAVAGTAFIFDVSLIHSPLSRALAARLKPASARTPSAAAAPAPTRN